MTQKEYFKEIKTRLDGIKELTQDYIKENNLPESAELLDLTVSMFSDYKSVILLRPEEVRTRDDFAVIDFAILRNNDVLVNSDTYHNMEEV